MNLVEGVKWSDGDAFDAEDLRFWWEDNVQDEKVASRMPKDGMGVGTTMSVVDPYTIRFDFKEPQGPARVSALAYIQVVLDLHISEDHHPRYNPQNPMRITRMHYQPDDLKKRGFFRDVCRSSSRS